MGYHRAGFDVVGVDLNPQKNYPFEFHQCDALAYLAEHFEEFSAVHASPPCQASSALTKGTNKAMNWGAFREAVEEEEAYVDLIPASRAFLDATGLPYVIENVQGSSLRRDMTLCGEMFGLQVLRHRYFELSGFSFTPPIHQPHRGRVAGYRHGEWFEGPYFAVYGEGGGKGTVQQWQDAMGIHWTNVRKEIAEAIPPAYTEFIGAQLLQHLATRQQAAA